MIPQGIQKITARKTIRFGERKEINRKEITRTTIQDNSRTGVGWESTNSGSTQGDRDEEDSKVHIFGNLAVVPHEASVDVLAVGKGRLLAE